MSQKRRQDSGLGITAGGGNGGSYAAYQRSVLAPPPPPEPERDPDSSIQWDWNETPRDQLPDEAPDGISSADWVQYGRWRKQLRTDSIPLERQTRRAPHGLRASWDARAKESLGKLMDMAGNYPLRDPSWSSARDESIRASAKAADPGCVGITITRNFDGSFTSELKTSARDPRFRPTPAESALSRRVEQAILAAGREDMDWQENGSGSHMYVYVPLP